MLEQQQHHHHTITTITTTTNGHTASLISKHPVCRRFVLAEAPTEL